MMMMMINMIKYHCNIFFTRKKGKWENSAREKRGEAMKMNMENENRFLLISFI